jgi:hypothetical protein
LAPLIGDTGAFLQGERIKGTYVSAVGANPATYRWRSDDITLDFTPEDVTNNDDIKVNLSSLSFDADTNNNSKRFLKSATLTLSQANSNPIMLGGIKIKANSATINYSDDRLNIANGRFKKTYTFNVNGEYDWDQGTPSTSDDIVLGLNGSGTYTQIATTLSTDIPGASLSNPWILKSGATPGPTESQAQGSWRGHAGAGFVGTAPVPWPSLLPVLI